VKPLSEALRGAAGRFIVFEGIDGSGTTTQGRALVASLERAGIAARFTHEPSGGPLGLLLRQLLTGTGPSPGWDCMALLFAADRLDHVTREIRPALDQGITVICDRYDLSSLAYQSATAPEAEAVLPWIQSLNRRALRPHLTLVLDVDPNVAESRRAERGGPPELFERRDLQRSLAEIYASAERLVPLDVLVHVDANLSITEVEAGVMREVAQRFAAQ